MCLQLAFFVDGTAEVIYGLLAFLSGHSTIGRLRIRKLVCRDDVVSDTILLSKASALHLPSDRGGVDHVPWIAFAYPVDPSRVAGMHPLPAMRQMQSLSRFNEVA